MTIARDAFHDYWELHLLGLWCSLNRVSRVIAGFRVNYLGVGFPLNRASRIIVCICLNTGPCVSFKRGPDVHCILSVVLSRR